MRKATGRTLLLLSLFLAFLPATIIPVQGSVSCSYQPKNQYSNTGRFAYTGHPVYSEFEGIPVTVVPSFGNDNITVQYSRFNRSGSTAGQPFAAGATYQTSGICNKNALIASFGFSFRFLFLKVLRL